MSATATAAGKSSSAPASAKNNEDTAGAPTILLFWAAVYRCTPKFIKIPFTKVDVTMAFLSAAFLHLIRVVMAPIMIADYGWPKGHRWTEEGVASVVSMVHATLLVPSLYICLRTQPYKPCARFDEAPSWWSDAARALVLLCTGYMIQDTIFGVLVANYVPGEGLILTEAEFPFIAHHIITVSYMMSTFIVGAGHISAMILMFLGECTNPLFNCFLMAISTVKLDFCCRMTAEMFQVIAIVNCFFYVLFRAVISPPYIFHLGYDLLLTKEGRKNIPLPLSCYFFFCGLVVLHGSAPWTKDAYEMLQDALAGKMLANRYHIE